MKTVLISMMLGAFLWVGTSAQIVAAEPKGILKPAEVATLVKSAKSPAEHRKLASHYTAMAEKHEADAKEHEALAAAYTSRPTGQDAKHPMSGETAAHCKFYAEHCRMAAKDMRAMAAIHEGMAKGMAK